MDQGDICNTYVYFDWNENKRVEFIELLYMVSYCSNVSTAQHRDSRKWCKNIAIHGITALTINALAPRRCSCDPHGAVAWINVARSMKS